MSYSKTFASLGLVAALAFVPSIASAQGRSHGGQSRGGQQSRGSGRASRPPARVYRPPVRVAPSRPFYRTGYRSYRPGINLGFFYGRPGFYGSYVYGSPFYRYGYPGYAYDAPYYAPYGYGYGGYSGQPYGGVRIDLPQRDAEVFVDGYFVGTVDNFDGVLQQANIEAGPHRIEVSAPGFETVSFDVNVEPGRTITYRSSMRPLRP